MDIIYLVVFIFIKKYYKDDEESKELLMDNENYFKYYEDL